MISQNDRAIAGRLQQLASSLRLMMAVEMVSMMLLMQLVVLFTADLGKVDAKTALEKVQKHLEERVDQSTATVDQFVSEAGKLLEEGEQKFIIKTFSKDYLELLQAFSQLGETVNRCNENSYQILDHNHRLTGNKMLAPRSELSQPVGIVEEIIHQYTYLNARYCTDRLVMAAINTNRRLLKRKFVREALGLVRALGKAQLEREHGQGWAGSGALLIESLFVLADLGGSPQDGQVARRALSKLTKGSEFEALFASRNKRATPARPGMDTDTGSGKLNKEQVRLAMSEYLEKPCIHYVEGLEELFNLTELDFRVLEDAEKPDFASNIEFYEIWAQYRLCSIGLQNFDKLLGSTFAATKQLQTQL